MSVKSSSFSENCEWSLCEDTSRALTFICLRFDYMTLLPFRPTIDTEAIAVRSKTRIVDDLLTEANYLKKQLLRPLSSYFESAWNGPRIRQ